MVTAMLIVFGIAAASVLGLAIALEVKKRKNKFKHVLFSRKTAKVNPGMIMREYRELLTLAHNEVMRREVKLDDNLHVYVGTTYKEPYDLEFIACEDPNAHKGLHRRITVADLNGLNELYSAKTEAWDLAVKHLEDLELEYGRFKREFNSSSPRYIND